MKIPNADRALINAAKITGYLLNSSHPDNRGKTAFFEALGFSRNEIAIFAAALRSVAMESDIVVGLESPHGYKYVVDGEIASPIGKRSHIRTVWIVDEGQDLPRLVTAYPHEKQ